MIRFLSLVLLLLLAPLADACHGSSNRAERRAARYGAGGCSGVEASYGCSGATVGYSRTTTVIVSPHGTAVAPAAVPAPVDQAPTAVVGTTTVVPTTSTIYVGSGYSGYGAVNRGRVDYGRPGTGILRRNARRNLY